MPNMPRVYTFRPAVVPVLKDANRLGIPASLVAIYE